jgi:hypothetical protein
MYGMRGVCLNCPRRKVGCMFGCKKRRIFRGLKEDQNGRCSFIIHRERKVWR